MSLPEALQNVRQALGGCACLTCDNYTRVQVAVDSFDDALRNLLELSGPPDDIIGYHDGHVLVTGRKGEEAHLVMIDVEWLLGDTEK